MDSRRRGVEARPPGRVRPGPDLSGRPRPCLPEADPPAGSARHRRDWSPPSTARTAGGETPRSGCSPTAETRPPSSRSGSWPDPASGRRPASRRSGRSATWAVSIPIRSCSPCGTPIRRSVERGSRSPGPDRRLDGRVLEALLALVEDPDPEVQFALAIALGDSADPRAGRALARLAIRAGDDPWSRAAILSSAVPHASAILAGLFEGAGREGPPRSWVEPLFALAASRPGENGLKPLLDAVGTPRTGGFAPGSSRPPRDWPRRPTATGRPSWLTAFDRGAN